MIRPLCGPKTRPFWFLFLILIVACSTERRPEQAGAPVEEGAGPALQPTPTLAAGARQIFPPPTPPITPRAGALPEAAVAPSPTATATVASTPTATPLPAERLDHGRAYMAHGNFDAAAREFQLGLSAPGALTPDEQEGALWGLAQAYLQEGRWQDATEALNHYLSLATGRQEARPIQEDGISPAGTLDAAGVPAPSVAAAHFHLADAYREMGDCATAIPAFERYLEERPWMGAYVHPLIAGCHLQQGDNVAATAAYTTALQSSAHRLVEVEIRQTLADLHLESGDYLEAVEQYDAIHNLAVTENTRGQMSYLAGVALLQAGDEAAAYERFLFGVENYPRSYSSYQGLVALVDAGYEVDLYQRGLVDYYAEAYFPAIDAFNRYVDESADDFIADAHLYLAWSYEATGNQEAALAQLDAYSAFAEAESLFERAALYARAEALPLATDAYLELVDGYPESELAPDALWQAALVSERQEEAEVAIERYRRLAEAYPAYSETPLALFRAGRLAWVNGDQAGAQAVWKELAAAYPDHEYGAAALVWLGRTLPEEEGATYLITATQQLTGSTYYPLRARELARGAPPFQSPISLTLSFDEEAERRAANRWLEEWLELEAGEATAELSPDLAQDERLLRGEELWRLGRYAGARQELEALRLAHAEDALATYQLAHYFRDLGLYRSSILAADTLLRLSGETPFQAPHLVGRLAYPVYYADLILPLAEEQGYDPLLQFSLERQESLFESFIASYVGAQGLSQVMPATGADIARRLSWPDYQNEDLYRPYVGLAFGAYYLGEQLRAFDGDVYAALSAYNAGPGNAARWYAVAPADPDLYIETVDFRETRLYIERIYTGYAVYRHLYGSE